MANRPAGYSGDDAGLYVEARRVLLDALGALRDHHGSLVLIGAQAVYLRSERAALQVAAYTSDGDLGLDPRNLAEMPRIEEAMREAGFELPDPDQPGLWVQEVKRENDDDTFSIEVDLLVPEELAGAGTRAARIPPHEKKAARRVRGIEATLVDKSPLAIPSLDPAHDARSYVIDVAGPAALLIAKAFKIHERVESGKPGRLSDKDAGDVVRLMMTNSAVQVRESIEALLADPMAGESVSEGMEYLRQLFGTDQLVGTQMAVRALQGSLEAERIQLITSGYMAQLRSE